MDLWLSYIATLRAKVGLAFSPSPLSLSPPLLSQLPHGATAKAALCGSPIDEEESSSDASSPPNDNDSGSDSPWAPPPPGGRGGKRARSPGGGPPPPPTCHAVMEGESPGP